MTCMCVPNCAKQHDTTLVLVCSPGCLPGREGASCTVCAKDFYSAGGSADGSLACTACDPCWTTNDATGATACVWMAAGTNCSDMVSDDPASTLLCVMASSRCKTLLMTKLWFVTPTEVEDPRVVDCARLLGVLHFYIVSAVGAATSSSAEHGSSGC